MTFSLPGKNLIHAKAAADYIERELLQNISRNRADRSTYRLSPGLRYMVAGGSEEVLLADLESHAANLYRRRIIQSFKVTEGAVEIVLTRAGRAAILTEHSLKAISPPPSRASRKKKHSASVGNVAPTREVIGSALIQLLLREPCPTKQLTSKLLTAMGFATPQTRKPLTAGVGADVNHIVGVLGRLGATSAENGVLRLNEAAVKDAKSGILIASLKEKLNKKNRTNGTSSGLLRAKWINLSNAEREERLRLREVMAFRAPKNYSKASMEELLAVWRWALHVLAADSLSFLHPQGQAALRKLRKEWKTRDVTPDEDRYFKWPSTFARGGDGSLIVTNSPDLGMLALLNYHVGRTRGLPVEHRRQILSQVFDGRLPPVLPRKGMEEWGGSGTAHRLQKMAVSIASFARNAKRNGPSYRDAVDDWEADLAWLYQKYYVGVFNFGWPCS